MTLTTPNKRLYEYALWGTLTVLGLYAARVVFGYAVFHTFVELYAVTVAIGTFMVTWNARRLIDNDYLLFLGISFFFVAGADALHMMTYKDVAVFKGYSEYELPTQLWLVGRYLQASAIVIAPVFVRRRLHPSAAFGAYLAITAALVAATFTGLFPSVLPEPGGLTAFKIGSEWLVIAAFGVGLIGLFANRRHFDPQVLRLLAVSIAAGIAAEFAFTLYGDPFAAPNFIGHLLRLVTYFALYRAIIVTGVGRPRAVLARQLQRANQQLETSRDLSEALNSIDREINSTFDLDEIMSRAATLGAAVFGADAATVWSEDDGGWTPHLAHGYPEILVGRTMPGDAVPYVAEALASRRPVAVEDAAARYGDAPFMAQSRHSMRSLIAIPLLFRKERYGALTFVWRTDSHRFTPEERDFARKLGSALALAVDNGRLYEAQTKISETLQASMLRVESDIPGIDSAYAYRSTTELAQIGGDFFDLFAVDDGRVAFVIGDVAGKGLSAAALTQIAKNTIRSFAYELREPKVVMEAANRAISHQVSEGRFITAVYGLLDPTTGVAEVVCAGHPLPLACDAAGCIDQHGVRNPPLGVFPDFPFEQFTITLDPGMRLIMYTDGLLDTRRDSEFFGEFRVNELIDSLGDADPEDIAQTLMDAAVGFSDGHPTDDIAILVLRYVGRSAS